MANYRFLFSFHSFKNRSEIQIIQCAKMPESPQGIYAPLPQSLTDSDSEEELHNSTASNATARRQSIYPEQYRNNIRISEGGTHIGEGTEITINSNMRRSLHCGDSTDDNRYGMFSDLTDDNIAILQKTPTKPSMSFLRKCCFIFSIQMCFVTVFVFIWALPCSDQLACPVRNEEIRTHKWIREYEDIELKGMINVVDGRRGRSKNLVLMYRIDKIMKDQNVTWHRKNGIICLVGGNGQVAWFDEMVFEPKAIDCNLIDANQDGSLDCIVVDEYSHVGCINPVTGEWIWHSVLQEKNILPSDLYDFPLVLRDLNRDKVPELLVVSSLNTNLSNNLVIINGANGQQYSQIYTDSECDIIHKLQIDLNQGVSYSCITNASYEKTKFLEKLAPQLALKINFTKLSVTQHKTFGQRKSIKNQRNIYAVSGKQLIIENKGTCPNNCSVIATLIDKNETVIFNGTRMYGMVPTQLSFNKSTIDSKSDVHGFVFKLWEWYQNDSGLKPTTKADNSQVHNIFSKNLKRHKRWTHPMLYRDSRDIHPDNFTHIFFRSKLFVIKETVVLIIFNSTQTRVMNTSLNDIWQLCREDTGGIFCQPDLNYQENSLKVCDLDLDGSQELVSYYTTYKDTDDTKNPWKLLTYVQLMKLEAELPLLYDTKAKK